MSNNNIPDDLIPLGKILKSRGLKGEVRVFLYNEGSNTLEKDKDIWIKCNNEYVSYNAANPEVSPCSRYARPAATDGPACTDAGLEDEPRRALEDGLHCKNCHAKVDLHVLAKQGGRIPTSMLSKNKWVGMKRGMKETCCKGV